MALSVPSFVRLHLFDIRVFMARQQKLFSNDVDDIEIVEKDSEAWLDINIAVDPESASIAYSTFVLNSSFYPRKKV